MVPYGIERLDGDGWLWCVLLPLMCIPNSYLWNRTSGWGATGLLCSAATGCAYRVDACEIERQDGERLGLMETQNMARSSYGSVLSNILHGLIACDRTCRIA